MSSNCTDNVAIFIPTHNRPHCLARLLSWLNHSNFSIYIGDSSRESNKVLINSLELKSLKVKYFHKPDWNIYEKWEFILQNIVEKYTVTCAEDDIIFVHNLEKFFRFAEKSNAGCVVGREIFADILKDKKVSLKSSQDYREFCIKNSGDVEFDLESANNPIVCTFYQFFLTDVLRSVHSHWLELSHYYPGNKIQEIVYRSSTFILSSVFYFDHLLNLRTNEPTLRYQETTLEASRFRKNFWDEVKELAASKKTDEFLEAHSTIFAKSTRWNITPRRAFALTKNLIWFPMLNRMSTKHEILWQPRYVIVMSTELLEDSLCRTSESVIWNVSLMNPHFRKHRIFSNIQNFLINNQNDWDAICRACYLLLK